jgi:ketosteroid isomerase-like protein
MPLRKLNPKLRITHASLLVILFTFTNSIGQEVDSIESNEDIMISVYNDLWQPFMESYRDLDIEKFKSLQANDLTRVSIDRNTIQTKTKYFEEIEGFFKHFMKMDRQLDIKFSILSTAIGENKVFQTGYYCVGSKTIDSESFHPMGYGFFTVVLIKEDGQWKISLDADKQSDITDDEFRNSEVFYEIE